MSRASRSKLYLENYCRSWRHCSVILVGNDILPQTHHPPHSHSRRSACAHSSPPPIHPSARSPAQPPERPPTRPPDHRLSRPRAHAGINSAQGESLAASLSDSTSKRRRDPRRARGTTAGSAAGARNVGVTRGGREKRRRDLRRARGTTGRLNGFGSRRCKPGGGERAC